MNHNRNTENNIDVTNLCSRKLWELLKNAEWHNDGERFAIVRELSGRQHYLEELARFTISETRH
jgi:hypothetical protein